MHPNRDPREERLPSDDFLDLPREDPREEDGEWDGRTYLYIRTHPLDTGAEPFTASPHFWISPDIQIRKPDNTLGTEAVPGVLNHIEITVTNGGGMMAKDAYVDVYLNIPSTVMTPKTSINLGGGTLTIPPHGTAVLKLPWTPPVGEDPHRCMIGRVSLIAPPDTYKDPTIFDVIGDRHIAQRNLHVGSMPPAQQNAPFEFMIANAGGVQEGVVVVVEDVSPQWQSTALQQAFGGQGAQMRVRPMTNATLTINPPMVVQSASPSAATPLNIDAEGCLTVILRLLGIIRGTPSTREKTVVLAAEETRTGSISIERDPAAQRGDVHVLQVTQQQALTRRIVGGFTLILRYE